MSGMRLVPLKYYIQLHPRACLVSGVEGSGLEPMKRFKLPIFSMNVSFRGSEGVDGGGCQ